jgi:hypothetical protein
VGLIAPSAWAKMDGVTIEDELLALARRELGESSRWLLSVARDDRGFVLVAEHHASPGLVIELAPSTATWPHFASPGGSNSVRSR